MCVVSHRKGRLFGNPLHNVVFLMIENQTFEVIMEHSETLVLSFFIVILKTIWKDGMHCHLFLIV